MHSAAVRALPKASRQGQTRSTEREGHLPLGLTRGPGRCAKRGLAGRFHVGAKPP